MNRLQRLAVLYSGGSDSETLLRASAAALGSGNVMALTADTLLLADFYRNRVREVTGEIGVEHLFVPLNPLSDKEIAANGTRRCYHCKKLIMEGLIGPAGERGFNVVADGTTLDDLADDRPGLAAADEAGVIHPFAEAGLGASEVLELRISLGVLDPAPPSDSCYATRIDGIPLTRKAIEIVALLEEPLRAYARGRIRVKYDGECLDLNYTASDEDLILGKIEELRRRAALCGLPLHLSKSD